MTVTPDRSGSAQGPPEGRPTTLIWIDAQEALFARWAAGRVTLERLVSEVPDHRGSTGHVRHDPLIRHGGGGSRQDAGEPHRLEHLRRFVRDVGSRIPPCDDVILLGPGTVHLKLESWFLERDTRDPQPRSIVAETSARLTERQLVARVRRAAGDEPRRRTVGAYRWSGPVPERRSGHRLPPRRILEKPPRDAG